MTERELLLILSLNIRTHRNRRKWTQSELAEKVNISINFLSDIETGKKWASPITLVKFAEVFNIQVYELLKPKGILPDNRATLVEKYKEDICSAIDEVHNEFLSKLNKPRLGDGV